MSRSAKGAVPSCRVKWDTQTQKTIQRINLYCKASGGVLCRLSVVMLTCVCRYTHKQPIQRHDHVHGDICTPTETQLRERRRRLCDGLWEESGSGLVCAKSPVLSQNGRKKKKKKMMTAHLGQTVFVSNFRCLFERSQENQADRVYCIKFSRRARWTVSQQKV